MPPETEAARLYDTFGASLFRYALMILANREAAEDVIQQVFLALLDRRAGRLEDEERFLRRSVRNACYSAIRHQKVRMGPPVDESLLEAAGQGPAISEDDLVRLTSRPSRSIRSAAAQCVTSATPWATRSTASAKT